jgi:hypothetical protein
MIEGRNTPKDTLAWPVLQTFVCLWHDGALEARSLVAAAWLTKVGQSEGPRSGRMGVERGHYSEEGGCVLHGEGSRPPLDTTVRRTQAQHIGHRRQPARHLAERVVSPHPEVLGRDTTKDIPALVVSLRR